MVKLSTKSEFSTKNINSIIDDAANQISAWTHKEFKKLNSESKLPLIWPMRNGGFVVGDSRISSFNEYWMVQIRGQDRSLIFESRRNAVVYCLLEQMANIKLANDILNEDNKILRLKNSLLHYSYSLKRYVREDKSFEMQTCDARIVDAQVRLESAYKESEKILCAAKYMIHITRELKP